MAIYETIRSDGLRIITWHVPELKRVHMELVAGVGSAYDPSSMDGLFHFFEHMAFKGTIKRTAEDLQLFRNQYLLSWNATLDRVATWYEAEAVPEKLGFVCEWLCDAYFNSVFPMREWVREKEVIKEEIAICDDSDGLAMQRELFQLLRSQNPLRMKGTGTYESIDRITRDDMLAAQKYWHVPSNTTAFVVGDVMHEQFCEYVNAHIPVLCANVEHSTWSDEYDMLPAVTNVVIERQGRQKGMVLYGCKVPHFSDLRARVIANIFEYLLVKDTASRLWIELREKRALLYKLDGGISYKLPLGIDFGALVLTRAQHIDEIKDLMFELLMQPLCNQIEFDNRKNWLADLYSCGYEGTTEYVNEICFRLQGGIPLYNIDVHYNECINVVSSIQLEEVEEFRRKVLNPNQLVTVILKPA